MDPEAYADMLPWAVFMVVDRKSGLGMGWAAGSGAVSGALLLAWAYWHGRRSSAGILAVGLFGMMGVVTLIVGSPADHFIGARAVAMGALAIAALVSLRWSPMSEIYTSANISATARADDRFHQLNFAITAAWAVGALLIAVSFSAVVFDRSPVAVTFFNWVLPLGIGAATVKWVAARWQMFRLEVEGADADQVAEGSLLSLAVPEADDGQDAVIHQLPLPDQSARRASR